MAEPISRKQFFRQAFVNSARFSAELLDAFQPARQARLAPTDYDFGADLPPELLAAEAERLGVDPEDKAAVMAAIAERMQPPQY
ncbi:hypothetical protein SAMN02745165_02383 [Malonomonas rubra DSM 5091]|uniref:Uncharacterized protein n=1 Tax=Malonomonas rubra DSM 5091 TaxID=1122189 RepID=A0A1M6JBM5_MALRU|nr:hypothetical protein [Malonomonas rubra]SHJ44091.1 hypothetical protein SAMN02745165_02383 [Malonomonas rubra DSM 5091]